MKYVISAKISNYALYTKKATPKSESLLRYCHWELILICEPDT